MSIRAPRSHFFNTENESIRAPLADGWTFLDEGPIVCRPWRVMVFNTTLADFAGTPASLADLAFADENGEQLPHAGDLGALLGLLTTLPSDVRANMKKGAPTLAATFQNEHGNNMLKTQLVLEPLRSPLEPFAIVGLRLFVLLFDHKGRFPTLTSGLWQRVMTSNDLRRKREAVKARPPPVNSDPAVAVRYVFSMATLGKTWKNVLGNNINGTKRTLQDWVANHPTSVTNEAFNEAVVIERNELYIHRLSPEWLLRFCPETLLMRAPMETSAAQLNTETYFKTGDTTFTFPDSEGVLLFAGDCGALRAPFPIKLANDLLRAHELVGGAGQSYHGSSPAEGGSMRTTMRTTRKRSRDLEEYSSSSDESEE